MLDDFFTRALVAGIGVALVACPLGCFLVWRRMAYFGATMSHGALLGVALALLVGIDPTLGVLIQGAIVVPALILLERRGTLSSDTLLGILAHGTLALGLIVMAFLTWVRVDLMAYLFGDVLAVTVGDIAVVYVGGAAMLAMLLVIWRPLLAGTVNAELAAAEGLDPERARIVFMLLIAGVVALAMKVVGVLLILSLLIIPPAAARSFAASPERMAVVSAGLGVVSVVAGLYGSLAADTPAGPSIVVAALVVFLVSLVPFTGRGAGAPARPRGSA